MSARHVSRRQRRRVEIQLELISLHLLGYQHEITMLDVGTEWGLSAIETKRVFPDARIYGVEAHAPSATEAEASGAYQSVLYAEAIGALEYLWADQQADVVLAAEIVEHHEKAEGLELLRLVEERARHLAIVTSPIGLLAQGELDGNPWQVHRSGWTPEELEALGWTTYAADRELNLFVSYKAKP